MNPPPPQSFGLSEVQKAVWFVTVRDCLELLCFPAVTWWRPHLNGGGVAFFSRPPEASVLQAAYSLQGLCVSQAANPEILTSKRSGSRRYSLFTPVLKVVGLLCREEAYYCTGLQLMLFRELCKPAERCTSVSLFCQCIIAASFRLKCIRFCWSQVKCSLKTRLLHPQ